VGASFGFELITLGWFRESGRLYQRRQAPGAGWEYCVGVPTWRNTAEGDVEPAWYVVWVKAPDHLRRVERASYDDVATTRLPPSSTVREMHGPRRPTGWIL
jgi:hypothetical protein